MSLFVKLETAWVDHPKIIRAGMAGRGLHATVLCLAKRLETDGWVDRILLHREGADDELIDELVKLTLLEQDGDRVRPWGWHDRNPSQDAIDARRASRSEAGRRGNHARHGHAGLFEECPTCNPRDTNPTSSQRATDVRDPATASDRNPSPESESDTETPPPAPPASPDREPGGPPRAAAAAEETTPIRTDEQTIRRTAALIGRHEASIRPIVDDRGAYAAQITRRILTDPDRTDRDRIVELLKAGQTPEAIADRWAELDTGPPEPIHPSHFARIECDRCDGAGVWLDDDELAHTCRHDHHGQEALA